MKRLWRVSLAGLLVILLLAAIGAFGFFKLVQYRIAARLQPPILEHSVQSPADLVYTTLDGQPEHLSSLRGKVVFLNLWGTWCVQCVAEMPTVQKLYDHYQYDPSIVFVIASRLDSASHVRAYARLNHLDLPFYLIKDSNIPISMRLNQYPATFIFAKGGSIAAEHVGAADWANKSVVQLLDQLERE